MAFEAIKQKMIEKLDSIPYENNYYLASSK
jgi:hypothetical protein